MRWFYAVVLLISLVYATQACQPYCNVPVLAYFSGANCSGTATYEPVTLGCFNTTEGSEHRYFDDNGVYKKRVLNMKCGQTTTYEDPSYFLETRKYGVCNPLSPYNVMLKRTPSHIYPVPQPYRPPNPAFPVANATILRPCRDPAECMASNPTYYYAYYDNVGNCTTPTSFKAAHVATHGICFIDAFDSIYTYSVECGPKPNTMISTTYVGNCEAILVTYISYTNCNSSDMLLHCTNNNPNPYSPLGPAPEAPSSSPGVNQDSPSPASPSSQNPTYQVPSSNPSSASPSSPSLSNPSIPAAKVPTSKASKPLSHLFWSLQYPSLPSFR